MKIIASIISCGILFINELFPQKTTQRNLQNDKFFEIKYEELLKQKTTIKLSQVASEISYIQLETSLESLIFNNAKYYFCDNFIFVRNRDHILKFSLEGKFLKKIGSPGRGPGEINLIHNISILPDKKIIVIHDYVPHKLLYFNFEGNLIKIIKIPRFVEVNSIDNSRYLAISQEPAASEKYTHLLLHESGDTISAVTNYEVWKSKSSYLLSGISNNSFVPFYTYRNQYYIKSMYNDTVFVVHSNKLTPSYYINLGKYRLPEEKRIERLGPAEARLFEKNAANFFFSYVFESGKYLFLTTNEWGGDNRIEHFVINKKGFIANSDDKYSGVYKGYIDNDWDGGALFWPKGNINDNTVFMPIYVADLKNIINFRNSSKSLKTLVKFPDKRTQMEKMVSDLDISDNPILMVVTLK